MSYNEFRRYLLSLGARIQEGKKHTKVYLNDRQSTLPRHGTREMTEGLRLAILKQLDVERKG
jgi:mRNA interferase HicA